MTHPLGALSIGTLGAVSVLVLVPSSATAGHALGSYYPIIASIVFLTCGLARARDRLKRPPFVAPIIFFYIIVTCSTILSSTPNPFWLVLPLVILSLFWSTYSANERETEMIVRGIVLLALIQLALAIGEVFLNTGVLIGQRFMLTPDNPFIEYRPRAQGTLAHPLVLSFLFLAALGLICSRQQRKMPQAILTLAFIFGTVLTGSSSGLIIALVVALLQILQRAASFRTPIASLAAVIVIFITLFAAADLMSSIVNRAFDEHNAEHRMNSILAVPNLLFERNVVEALVGSGNAKTANLYASNIFVNDGFFAIDNQYVSFLVQGGLLGLLLMMISIVGITRRIATRSSRRFLPGWLGLLAMGFSFDFMAWYATSALFIVYLSIAIQPRSAVQVKPRAMPHASHQLLHDSHAV